MNGPGMNGKKVNRAVLDKPRARRDAAKLLAIALQTRYRKFLESAGDEDATVVATGDLAQCMYENVEFIIWALKVQGGLNPPPPEALKPVSAHALVPPPANDAPKPETVLDLPCTCPPHDPRLIGYKHMASCPKFKPD